VRDFADFYRLSGREAAVLLLAAEGLHRKESAFRLGCSPGTVDTYWRRIFRKTQQPSQGQLFVRLLCFTVEALSPADVEPRSGAQAVRNEGTRATPFIGPSKTT
jgi:DNA-binding CsgD family transcriptional regulator